MSTYPGIGSGLHNSAEIINNHGESIFVSSKGGKGSAFTFTLPLLKKLNEAHGCFKSPILSNHQLAAAVFLPAIQPNDLDESPQRVIQLSRINDPAHRHLNMAAETPDKTLLEDAPPPKYNSPQTQAPALRARREDDQCLS